MAPSVEELHLHMAIPAEELHPYVAPSLEELYPRPPVTPTVGVLRPAGRPQKLSVRRRKVNLTSGDLMTLMTSGFGSSASKFRD